MSEKTKYGEEFESFLVEWNARFDELEAMMGNADADPMVAYDKVIAGLRRHRPKAKAGNEKNSPRKLMWKGENNEKDWNASMRANPFGRRHLRVVDFQPPRTRRDRVDRHEISIGREQRK